MPPAASYKAVLNVFNTCSDSVKWYFDQVPDLLPNYPYDVTLAYLFLRTERAQNRALYCGVVKLHRVSGTVADAAVSDEIDLQETDALLVPRRPGAHRYLRLEQ